MKVIPETYMMKVIPETYLMKVIERTWWRLFQKRIVRIQFDIYIFIMTIVTIYKILNLKIKLTATI